MSRRTVRWKRVIKQIEAKGKTVDVIIPTQKVMRNGEIITRPMVKPMFKRNYANTTKAI